MTKPEYLYFLKEGKSQSGKTDIYQVLAVSDQTMLGIISWFGRWHQYTFFPEPKTCFNIGCMQTIIEFMREQNLRHILKLKA